MKNLKSVACVLLVLLFTTNIFAVQSGNDPVLVPEPTEKSLNYHYSGNVLWVINVLLSFLIPVVILFMGFSVKIRNFAQRIGKKWLFVICLYFILFSLLVFIIDFPLAYYQGFVREHEYGLSNKTFEKWLGDMIKCFSVNTVTGCLFLWIPYLLIRKSPRRWWFYTGLAAIPVFVFMFLAEPIIVDPIFNEFTPMKNKELEKKILTLANRAGIEADRVYQVNASADAKTINAYVTGIFGTHRIVLWDTAIEKLDEKELLFVMGHEMGHYVLGHVLLGLGVLCILSFVLLYILFRLGNWFVLKFKDRFGFDSVADIASLPLLLLLVSVIWFAARPAFFAGTRYIEHEADRFGLEITKDNRSAATAFVKFQHENLSNPRPGILYKLWRSTHPSLAERIEFCNTYRPWEKGEPLKYGHLFK